jgi:hypothetical protein
VSTGSLPVGAEGDTIARVGYGYAFERETELVVLRWTGSITMEERLACVAQLSADPLLEVAAGLLLDVSEATEAPSIGEVPRIVHLIEALRSKMRGPRRVAIVNASAGRRILTTLVAGFNATEDVGAFATEAAARAWLRTSA